MAGLARIVIVMAVLFYGTMGMADDRRAQINYLIHCQGCHLHEAVGVPGNVPRMKDFVGFFLHSPEGREFLVRVPGVSTATLQDDEIAELMNWILKTYSFEQMPSDFEPYTRSEIARLRSRPEPDPETTRQKILEQIAATLPTLAEQLASTN